jgi:hypothetical protein
MVRASTVAVIAALALSAAFPATADPAEAKPECRRFVAKDAEPGALAPRLARLCVRLVDANASSRGLSERESSAATLLGRYLAVVGELELRRGAAGLLPGGRTGGTTDAARYLIADRMGLIEVADALAPESPRTAELR